MDATTSLAIVQSAANSLGSNLAAILPVVLPVVITVAVLFFGWRKIFGTTRAR